jgi:hypothetical protein
LEPHQIDQPHVEIGLCARQRERYKELAESCDRNVDLPAARDSQALAVDDGHLQHATIRGVGQDSRRSTPARQIRRLAIYQRRSRARFIAIDRITAWRTGVACRPAVDHRRVTPGGPVIDLPVGVKVVHVGPGAIECQTGGLIWCNRVTRAILASRVFGVLSQNLNFAFGDVVAPASVTGTLLSSPVPLGKTSAALGGGGALSVTVTDVLIAKIPGLIELNRNSSTN